MEWVGCLKGALADLQAYVKAHHTTGLVWSKTVSHVIYFFPFTSYMQGCYKLGNSQGKLTNGMWFCVVCTLIDNDMRCHSGQNFDHCDDAYSASLSITVQTMLNNI